MRDEGVKCQKIKKYNNTLSCLDKNNNIFQTTRFSHTMIFFKLTD